MSKKRKIISPAEKLQILAELNRADCKVSELAKLHNVSRTVLYKWLKANKEAKGGAVVYDKHFIELKLPEEATTKPQYLSKASLVFSDFSLVIEGDLGNRRLISLLKNLEKSC